MPQFELNGKDDSEFSDLPMIVQGYIECMFFTSDAPGVDSEEFWTDEYQADMMEGRTDGCLPSDLGFSDLTADALAQIQADCGTFHVKARDLLRQAYEREGYDAERAGHDFWYTRNGHGVGFWDRSALDADGLGEALSDIARSFGEAYPYATRDGKVGLE